MRTETPRPMAHLACKALLLISALAIGAGETWAQPTTTTPRAGWRVGGTTSAMARLGNVLYIGGNFRGIAPEPNASGSVLVVDPVSGSPMPGFPGFGGLTNAIEPDGAGGWYLGGNFLDVVDGAVQVRFRLAHVLANGDLDPAWTPTAEGGPVRALKLVPGVGLFVGGDFTSLSGTPRTRVGLLDTTPGGTGAVLPWNYAVGGGTTPQVRTLAHDGGALFIGGAFTTVDGVARANLVAVSASVSGQIGPNLAVDLPVDVVSVPTAGTVYVGGSFTTLAAQTRSRIARLTHPAGLDVTLDPWNPGADGTVRAFGVVDSSVFVGGDFGSIGGQGLGRFARVDATTGAASTEEFDIDGPVNGIAVSGTTVYLGGAFGVIQNQARGGAAAFSGTGALLPWNPSPAGTVSAVAVNGTQVALGGTIVGYGALPVPFLGALDLQTGQVLPWAPFPNAGNFDEIVVRGSVVYVAGNFTGFDDQGERLGLAAIDAFTGLVLPWDPSPNGPITGMVADDTYLYVAGNFTTISGQPRNRLARYRLSDQTLDPTFTPSITSAGGQVNDLVVAGTTLYVGGGLISINGGPAVRLAALDTTTGTQISGFAVSPSPGGPVMRMDFDNGFLYFAGNFTILMPNGTSRQFLAKADGTTGAIQPWSPGPLALDAAGVAAGFTVGANDVDAQGDTVLITGAFATVAGQVRMGLAQVNATDGALTAWAPNLGTPPTGGFGGPILSFPDITVIAGARLQLPDDLLNGLALFVEPSGQRPFPPTPLTAEIVGDTVTIRWGSAPLGSSATSFVLEAGSGRGLSNIASITVTGSSYTASGVPAGTYYVRVRAVTALGTSAPTDDLAITVGSASCTAPPQSPAVTYAEAEADGQVLVFWFGWSGSAPTSFVLEAGSGPGLANLATIELTSLPPVTFNNVPAGVYYLRVRSRNACGTSAPSPDFALSVGSAPTPPLAPFGLTATVSGGTVTLQWLAPSLSTVTSYLLEAGTTQGATDIAVIPLSGTSFSTGGVPSGVYFVRVRAVNSVGVSPPSSEFILVVP